MKGVRQTERKKGREKELIIFLTKNFGMKATVRVSVLSCSARILPLILRSLYWIMLFML